MRHPIRACLFAAPVLTGAVLAGTAAHAQSSLPADLLKGPEVEPPVLPGVERTFGGESPVVERTGSMGLPMQKFNKILGALRKHEDASLRLTKEQNAKLRKVQQEYNAEVRRFFAEEGMDFDEARKLMRSARAMAEGGEALDAEKIAMTKDIRKRAPHVSIAQERALALLTEDQRTFVRAEIEKATSIAAPAVGVPTNGAREMVQKLERMAQSGEIDFDALPPELANRLRKLPAQRRQRALQRMIESIKGRAKAERRPAPSVDGLQMPKP